MKKILTALFIAVLMCGFCVGSSAAQNVEPMIKDIFVLKPNGMVYALSRNYKFNMDSPFIQFANRIYISEAYDISAKDLFYSIDSNYTLWEHNFSQYYVRNETIKERIVEENVTDLHIHQFGYTHAKYFITKEGILKGEGTEGSSLPGAPPTGDQDVYRNECIATDVKMVSSYNGMAYLIKNDNSLWMWGYNPFLNGYYDEKYIFRFGKLFRKI